MDKHDLKCAYKKHTKSHKQVQLVNILLWLLGIPIPILLLIFLLWGCT
ncbi:MAG TPA: hypothetical protein VNE84_05625 [Candidatus Limnocylindria bacterium]|jgi:hypothetical protein|nr:hypothetical protein [Candidatus Limnocylindria bacterium]